MDVTNEGRFLEWDGFNFQIGARQLFSAGLLMVTLSERLNKTIASRSQEVQFL